MFDIYFYSDVILSSIFNVAITFHLLSLVEDDVYVCTTLEIECKLDVRVYSSIIKAIYQIICAYKIHDKIY